MKRDFALCVFAVILIAFGMVVTSAFGASSIISPAGDGVAGLGVIPLQGAPAPGATVYVDNVARTMQSLWERAGGTWLSGGTAPIGVYLICRSKDINIYFGGSTPTFTEGIPFVAGSSWQILGPTWVSTMKAISTSASDNVACPAHMIR
jgi:hypothetical protein